MTSCIWMTDSVCELRGVWKRWWASVMASVRFCLFYIATLYFDYGNDSLMIPDAADASYFMH